MKRALIVLIFIMLGVSCFAETDEALTLRVCDPDTGAYITVARVDTPQGFVFSNTDFATDSEIPIHDLVSDDASRAAKYLTYQTGVLSASDLSVQFMERFEVMFRVTEADETVTADIAGHTAYVVSVDYFNQYSSDLPYAQAAVVFITLDVPDRCVCVYAGNQYADESERPDRAALVEQALSACDALVFEE